MELSHTAVHALATPRSEENLSLTRLQGGLSLKMSSRFKVCANNDRERDAVGYQYQIFSKRGVVLLLFIKMIR